MIIQNDPFNGTAPRFIKIDLDHYHFTDFKEQKVTFGLKLFFNALPAFKYLLPNNI